ncbi:MAG: alpha/beta fold hydrolase [Synergistaceae bacterium]|nr:alpha/beta fold hydrolase [Synergistaceae bacterium]MBQ3654168.1 alpha/beta fold hydrolase [Synergistaceae bacterium]
MRKFFAALVLLVCLSGCASAYQVVSTNIVNPSTGKTLRGLLYKPETNGERIPIVLCAHELGSNHRRLWPQYGEALAAEGIAVYTFDFAGGGPKSRVDGQPGSLSDGETTEMSVMTEAADLEAVLEAVKGWDFVDPDRIAIIGGSQGGAVSVITAARHAGEIRGLVLLYPALLIRDDLHKKFPNKDACPPVYSYNGWLDVSPIYVRDMWDYDIYADMPKFTKSVLLLHGDKDNIVPMEYITKARETYPDVEFHVIDGGLHGFEGETFSQAIGYIKSYFRKIGMLPGGLSTIIPAGTPNTIAGEHFTGRSFLHPLSTQQVGVFNVTFEAGSYNEWHIHHAAKGGGQILIAISGRGWYQEEGKPAQELKPGSVVNIPANVKHWHGAAKDSWFQHIALEVPGEETRTTWHGFLPAEEYKKLP